MWIKKNKKLVNQSFVIGGAGLYNDVLENYNNLQRIYLTRISGKYGCDAIVDQLGRQRLKRSFRLVSTKSTLENEIKIRYLVYQRSK